MKYFLLFLLFASIYFYNGNKYIDAYRKNKTEYLDDDIRKKELRKRSRYMNIAGILAMIGGLVIKKYL